MSVVSLCFSLWKTLSPFVNWTDQLGLIVPWAPNAYNDQMCSLQVFSPILSVLNSLSECLPCWAEPSCLDVLPLSIFAFSFPFGLCFLGSFKMSLFRPHFYFLYLLAAGCTFGSLSWFFSRLQWRVLFHALHAEIQLSQSDLLNCPIFRVWFSLVCPKISLFVHKWINF